MVKDHTHSRRGNLLPPHRCNKGCGMCYPVCGIVHIKYLAANRHVVASAGFLLLSEWSFTICPTPYNRIKMC